MTLIDKEYNSPLVTIYICSKNYGKYLEEAIESVFRQYFKNWELLIVNDNSSDNTEEIMNIYKNDSRVSLINTNNIGLPSIANLALEKAKGEYIIRLDGDDIFDESILLLMVNFLKTHKDVSLVFSDYYLIDEGGEIFSHERRTNNKHDIYTKDLPPNGACALARVEDLRNNKYREDLGSQDGFDLWSKIRYKLKTFNINLPLFYYRRHNANLTSKISKIHNARLQIKKDANATCIKNYSPIIAIIPCRENYDALVNLWSAEIKGKSLLEIKIQQCLKIELFDKVIVASDTEKVLETLSKFDDKRLCFFKRDRDDTIRSRTLLHTFTKIAEKFDPNYAGLLVNCFYNSPFINSKTIEESIHTLIFNSANSCLGVEVLNEDIYYRTNYGIKAINQRNIFRTEQDFLFRDVKGAFATLTSNIKEGTIIGSNLVNYTVNSSQIYYIDSKFKLEMASKLNNND